MNNLRVTVIATVLNEGESIRRLMLSLASQTRVPDEIIIVDGGSTDQTVDILRSFEDQLPLTILVEEGCNISEGRNVAITQSTGEVIAATDAGVRLTDTWLEEIIRPFVEKADVDIVGGFFEADVHTLFDVAMGATVLPLEDEISADSFLPSSRSVAFKRTLAQKIGGYPEWLDYCEDLVFDFRMKAKAKHFVFAPSALVYFRPRTSFSSYYKQYYLYARGDGKADLWRKRHLIRYITYFVVAPIIILLSLFIHPLFLSLFVLGGAVYLYTPYRRLPTMMKKYQSAKVLDWLKAIYLIPIIRLMGDIAKMHGYPIGLYWRYQKRPPAWKP